MSHEISKDQAVTAMILWNHLIESVNRRGNRHDDRKSFIEDYGVSSARYAVIEMAADVEAVFLLMPDDVLERLSKDDFAHTLVLGCFDYENGPVPKLKHSHEAVADWVEANFGQSETATPGSNRP